MGRGRAAERAEQEPGGHEEQLNHGHVLEHRRVQERQRKIGRDRDRQAWLADPEAAGQGARRRQEGQGQSVTRRQRPGCDRPLPDAK